jgi:hypothetical protein
MLTFPPVNVGAAPVHVPGSVWVAPAIVLIVAVIVWVAPVGLLSISGSRSRHEFAGWVARA